MGEGEGRRGRGKKKETEGMHLKRTDVSRVRCIGNAKVYKPAAKSASHVPYVDASTHARLTYLARTFHSQTAEFELRQIAVVSESMRR